MVGLYFITVLIYLIVGLIGVASAKQWTVYSYTPNNNVSPLSKLRSCQRQAQDTQFCGAQLVDGNDCDLLMMEACDIPYGKMNMIHMRKTTVRLEPPFDFDLLGPLGTVHEYIPVHFTPGAEITVVLTPLIGWTSIVFGFYRISTPKDDIYDYSYTVKIYPTDGAIYAHDLSNLTNIDITEIVTPVACLTNSTYEIKISYSVEYLQVHVNGTLFLRRQIDVGLSPMAHMRVGIFGNEIPVLHSIQFDAATIHNNG